MKTSTKAGVLAAVALVVLVGLYVSNRQSNGGAFTIGVIAPLTGFGAEYGEEIRKGVQSAIDAHSKNCGADIRCKEALKVIFEDEKCEPKDAVSAFKKLTELDHASYIIGPGCGSPQEAITPLLSGKETIVLVPSAASAGLYEKSGGNLYNIQYSLEDESKFVAEKMFEKGYASVVVIAYKNAFSEAHVASFRQNYKGTLVKELWLTDDQSDLKPELAKLKSMKFDAIYAPDIAFFFAQGNTRLKQYGFNQPIFSTYVAELPAVRSMVEGVMYSYPGELVGDNGAVYELSREATESIISAASKCNSTYSCVKRELDAVFENGVKKRLMVLKKIQEASVINIE